MPHWIAPGWLAAGVAVTALVAALHLIAWRRPREVALPTARFIPDRPVRAASRTLRLNDVLLLLLRAAIVLLVAAAFARPVLARREGVRRVVLLDRSRAVRDPREALDSARAHLRSGDLVVPFAAHPARQAADSLDASAAAASRERGSLSAALVAAIAGAPALRHAADSLELVIVSPLAREELDAATPAIRARWGGRARLVRVALARAEGVQGVELAVGDDDALGAALARLGTRRAIGATPAGLAAVRVVRRDASAADSAWAAAGGTLVAWPDSGSLGGWAARGRADTALGLAAGGVAGASNELAIVAPFARRWRLVELARDAGIADEGRTAGGEHGERETRTDGTESAKGDAARSNGPGGGPRAQDGAAVGGARHRSGAGRGESSPPGTTSREAADTALHVVARWIDGEAAATERAVGAGCIRRVAVALPTAGDLPLDDAFGDVARRLTSPCGGPRDLAPASEDDVRALAGTGPLLATSGLAGDERSAATPWLLGAALLLALVESLVRARARRAEGA